MDIRPAAHVQAEHEGAHLVDVGTRLANLRAAVALASSRLEQLLEVSRVAEGKVLMSPAAEDVIASVHAALEHALEDDVRNALK